MTWPRVRMSTTIKSKKQYITSSCFEIDFEKPKRPICVIQPVFGQIVLKISWNSSGVCGGDVSCWTGIKTFGGSVAGVVPAGAVPVGHRTGLWTVWCYVAWSVDMSMGRPVNLSHLTAGRSNKVAHLMRSADVCRFRSRPSAPAGRLFFICRMKRLSRHCTRSSSSIE